MGRGELLALVRAETWAMEPRALETMVAALERGEGEGPSRLELWGAAGTPGGRSSRQQGARVGVLPLVGLLMPRGGALLDYFGGTGLDWWRGELRKLLEDSSVDGIVVDVHSPGGAVPGVEETAELLYAARRVKPIVAHVGALGASGAYWIPSNASRVVASLGAEVGSIGVFVAHFDYSEAMKTMGIKPTFIHAGRFKVEGNQYEPLSDEAKEAQQVRIDATFGRFVGAVARGRGTLPSDVRKSYGEGRLIEARAALDAGMVDEIAGLERAVELAAGGIPGLEAARSRAELEELRLRQRLVELGPGGSPPGRGGVRAPRRAGRVSGRVSEDEMRRLAGVGPRRR